MNYHQEARALITQEVAGDRGRQFEHRLVRLADEGVPVAAIARAMKRPSSEVWKVLKLALENGELIALPAADWPQGSRRESRVPGIAPGILGEVIREADALVSPLMQVFRLTASEARLVAALMNRREMTKPSLHMAIMRQDRVTEPKIVDVFVCKARRKLMPYQIAIHTIWGRGYTITKPNLDAIMKRLVDFDRQEMAA